MKEVIQLNISKNLSSNKVLIPHAIMVMFLQSGFDVDGDGGWEGEGASVVPQLGWQEGSLKLSMDHGLWLGPGNASVRKMNCD